MCRKEKFFICETCGNLVELVLEGGGTLVCCGNEMKELIGNVEEASYEKHIPEVKVDGNKVRVQIGSVIHPMTEEHYIQFIYLVTKLGVQRVCLSPGEDPIAEFVLAEGDEVVAAYEFCNLHGLWKKEM
ncbi:MAG TPA: desulfoferrodoxin FeS4 iron-binding domain-containing protein [Tissierellia bacterium]|jgi:superoxide reductase|nr:desulfoferrodoxin FeS4 iron-binding domain-containing protein [Tissierellia bacterium]